MIIARTSRQVAHHRYGTAPRRGLVGKLLLTGLKTTDRLFARYAPIVMIAGALALYGLACVILTALPKVFG
jgi:hypothetical protein